MRTKLEGREAELGVLVESLEGALASRPHLVRIVAADRVILRAAHDLLAGEGYGGFPNP